MKTIIKTLMLCITILLISINLFIFTWGYETGYDYGLDVGYYNGTIYGYRELGRNMCLKNFIFYCNTGTSKNTTCGCFDIVTNQSLS